MPSNTTSSVFFYVYVLESLKDGDRYIGYTSNLRKRLKEDKRGLSFSTKFRLPFRLIYFEGCLNSEDAKRREDYLKTTQGRRFLGLRLLQYQRSKTAFGTGRWYTGYEQKIKEEEVARINNKTQRRPLGMDFSYWHYTCCLFASA